MSNLQIEKKQLAQGIEYIKFSGVLDASGQNEILDLEQKITKIKSKTQVVFDFSDLTYLNSYSIGFIAHWYNFLHKQGGEIFLVNPQPQVYDTLNVLGITNVLKIFDDLKTALAEIQKISNK